MLATIIPRNGISIRSTELRSKGVLVPIELERVATVSYVADDSMSIELTE